MHPCLLGRLCPRRRHISSQRQRRPRCQPHRRCGSAAAAARSPAPADQQPRVTLAVWAPALAACCTWEARSRPLAAPRLPHSRSPRQPLRQLQRLGRSSRQSQPLHPLTGPRSRLRLHRPRLARRQALVQRQAQMSAPRLPSCQPRRRRSSQHSQQLQRRRPGQTSPSPPSKWRHGRCLALRQVSASGGGVLLSAL